MLVKELVELLLQQDQSYQVHLWSPDEYWFDAIAVDCDVGLKIVNINSPIND